jgi:flagellar hook-associated protein 2
MITQIQFGNIFSANGRNVISGSASGYDTEALIKGLVDAKRLPAVQLESSLELNGKKQSALSQMRDILTRFKDAANFLRNPQGVFNEADNVFEYRKATLSSNSSVAASTYLDVTAAPGATIADYEVTVDQLATYNVKTTNNFAAAGLNTIIVGADAMAGLPLNAGTIELGTAQVDVVLETGDTLGEVIQKINAVKDSSGVEATAIKVDGTNYRIQLKTLNTGTAQNYTLNSTPSPVFNMGFAIQQDAVDAEMTVEGTQITRSSNVISDLFDGLTFTLKQPTPTLPTPTEINVSVDPDTEIAKDGITNFIDTYNEFRIFYAQQTEIGTDGKPLDTAVLASSGVLRDSMSRVYNEMNRAIDGLAGGDPSRLADIGITFNDFEGDEETPFTRNIMTLDETKLTSALAGDFDAVRKVFEVTFGSDNNQFGFYKSGNQTSITEFSLSLNFGTEVYQATYDDGGTPVTIDVDVEAISGGYIVKGQAGSVLEGTQLFYSNTVNATADITLTQGYGDRLFNTLEDVLEDDTGILTIEEESLSDRDTRLQEEIDRIDAMIDRYRELLLDRFSALEQAVSAVNSILQSLQAQSDAAANS